jgi:hypothetical protein
VQGIYPISTVVELLSKNLRILEFPTNKLDLTNRDKNWSKRSVDNYDILSLK